MPRHSVSVAVLTLEAVRSFFYVNGGREEAYGMGTMIGAFRFHAHKLTSSAGHVLLDLLLHGSKMLADQGSTRSCCHLREWRGGRGFLW